MKNITVERYTPQNKDEWDAQVVASRNGTFLFRRNYMDYHSHRYKDHSMIIRSHGEIRALFPANEEEGTLVSHGGLTYGGLILPDRCGGSEVMQIFEAIIAYSRKNGIRRIIYKPVPHIYHRLPAEEELYALYRYNAKLTGRALSSTLCPVSGAWRFTTLRNRCIKKAEKNGVTVRETADFAPFWQILSTNLAERHSVSPVHTIDEITLLKHRFPENIRLYVSEKDTELMAGVVIYETPRCAHAQYIASTSSGRETGGLDIIFATLITGRYRQTPYFDFGISTEHGGEILNNGLLKQKEGFGATGTVYDTYEISTE